MGSHILGICLLMAGYNLLSTYYVSVPVLNTFYHFPNKKMEHTIDFLLWGRLFVFNVELKKPRSPKARQSVQACTASRDRAGV